MMISSGACSLIASRSACSGSGSTTAPRASIPAAWRRSSVRWSRRSAAERRLDSYTTRPVRESFWGLMTVTRICPGAARFLRASMSVLPATVSFARTRM